MEANPEYKRIIRSRVINAVPYSLQSIRRLPSLKTKWQEFLRVRSGQIHAIQDQLGLNAIDSVSRQAKIDSMIQSCSHLLDNPWPLFTLHTYVEARTADFKKVLDRLDGTDCEPETHSEARLTLKLEALGMWEPLVELVNFYGVLVDHMIEISELAASFQEPAHPLTQKDSSLAQGGGKSRLR